MCICIYGYIILHTHAESNKRKRRLAVPGCHAQILFESLSHFGVRGWGSNGVGLFCSTLHSTQREGERRGKRESTGRPWGRRGKPRHSREAKQQKRETGRERQSGRGKREGEREREQRERETERDREEREKEKTEKEEGKSKNHAVPLAPNCWKRPIMFWCCSEKRFHRMRGRCAMF